MVELIFIIKTMKEMERQLNIISQGEQSLNMLEIIEKEKQLHIFQMEEG